MSCVLVHFVAGDSLFLATITQEVSLNSGDVIPWDNATIDPGNNFDTNIGAYVAPVDGYYQ